MRYISTTKERADSKRSFARDSSTRQRNVLKRLFVLWSITICLMFVGFQSTPITHARGGCDLVCSDPFIDPNDGQCYQMCCPDDKRCGVRCELRPCKAQ